MNVISALKRTKQLVESSESTFWSHLTLEEITHRLQLAISAIEAGERADLEELSLLYAPTGAIQDTSIDNGWGSEFLELAIVVDSYVGKARQ